MTRAAVTIRVKRTVTTHVTVETVFKFAARVSHTSDDRPGIRRERARGGFRYRAPGGKLIRDTATLARIRSLAIPPAWEQVWICASPRGHVQATGRDARGRKQYRYHPAFRSSREGDKFGRVAAFGATLPKIRKRIEADLRRPGLPKQKVLAAVVKLLDYTHLRVGNAEYAKANKSFGLSTLCDRHVSFTSGSMRVQFRGKSGVRHERKVSDKRLARVVRSCRDLPGQHLFQYRTPDNEVRKIGSADVNAYIRAAAGGSFTAKDFRTWAGTVVALQLARDLPVPESRTAAEKAFVSVIEGVAAVLGNTPAVCRKSYVHPRVLEAFAAGAILRSKQRSGMSRAESGLLHLLDTNEGQ
ncbi:DNA topoisomerase IB [Gemmata sp. JC717]|uniref:DNA topoisomerase IB n=1 Tax=Gemmata algarum TaxID=2975278 RepID=UPI0021BA4493|nr:DNA topoisomerase IB [Gemmata algarum]MDY3555528.1 DNA topoisomerase IB [Gemmata algarum]